MIVTQQSIHRPLLFIFFLLKNINSTLSFSQNSNMCLFADYTNLKNLQKSIVNIEIVSCFELENIDKPFKKAQHNLIVNV